MMRSCVLTGKYFSSFIGVSPPYTREFSYSLTNTPYYISIFSIMHLENLSIHTEILLVRHGISLFHFIFQCGHAVVVTGHEDIGAILQIGQ